MPITVKNFGSVKPGPGVKPMRVQVSPKLPFGKKHPVNWWTGKHVPLSKTASGDGGAVVIAYSLVTHELYYETSDGGRTIIDTAVPETVIISDP